MKIPFHLFQKIRFRLINWNEYYILIFVLGILLNTLFGIVSEFQKFSWIFWTGFFLEFLAILLSLITDNIDKIFKDKTE